MPAYKTLLTGFNRYPKQSCLVTRPERYQELLTVAQATIARGRGCSYGDAALNENNTVILTERLNRFLAFDRTHGIITVESGITLQEILALIVPAGWFLPVTPGTQYASLGGCVATDAHGKNHLRTGSLGNHILELEIIGSNGKKNICSPVLNPDLFWATIGGMGLTGIISSIKLQLIPIKNSQMMVKQQITRDLTETLSHLETSAKTASYSIAWLDNFAIGKKFGQGIVISAHHSEVANNSFDTKWQQHLTIPFSCPGKLLNNITGKLFNRLYRWRQGKKRTPFTTDYQNYFYPLDSVKNWQYLYGKSGFIQYQFVLPLTHSLSGLQTVLERLHASAYPAFLATLKYFGKANSAPLSFPLPGFSLALDIPLYNQQLFAVLNELDDIIIKYGGRVYLAKDARLSAEHFRAMYPRYEEWLAVKKKYDAEDLFTSSLGRRLMLNNNFPY